MRGVQLSESNSVDGFKVSFYSVAIRKRVPCEGDQVDLGNMNFKVDPEIRTVLEQC